MTIKINNRGNTYKNRHSKEHKKKVGRPRIEFSYKIAKENRYISPNEVLQELKPIRKVDEKTGEVTDL